MNGRGNIIISWFGLCLWLISAPLLAKPLLEALDVTPSGPQSVQLRFVFDKALSRQEVTLKRSPLHLTLKIANAQGRLAANPYPLNHPLLKQLTLASSAQELAIEIALQASLAEQFIVQDSQLILTLTSSSHVQPMAQKSLIESQGATITTLNDRPEKIVNRGSVAVASAPLSGFVNKIQDVEFRRTAKGEGQLIVHLAEQSALVEVMTGQGGEVVARFRQSDISAGLDTLKDVSRYASAVLQVDVLRKGRDVEFIARGRGALRHHYQQNGRKFVLTLSKANAPRVIGSLPQRGRSDALSFNFQDIPVRTALQLIAEFNHINLVTSDSVTGNMTLRLDDVPWQQALDVILKVRGLDKRYENNILLVAPTQELAERERSQLESQSQLSDLAPIFTDYLQINYAKAADIAQLLASEQNRLLSSRGAVTVDERTNVLVIKDTQEVINNTKRMLNILDIPAKQVLIEARMVTIDDGFDEALGVRWGVTKNDGHGNGLSGSIEGNDGMGNNADFNGATRPLSEDRLNVNLPVNNAAGTLAFQIARLANGTLLDLELSALEKESKAEIIASPRVTTANQKAALIEQGTEIPYVEASSSGATTVSFKKAVLSLKVVPQITPDNRVILDLTVTQDTKGEVVPTGNGDAVSINAQSITTQVLVDNGETLVLGGIYQQSIKSDVSKVPLLGDIPGIGALFRRILSENKKRELLIFVTPKIVTQAL